MPQLQPSLHHLDTSCGESSAATRSSHSPSPSLSLDTPSHDSLHRPRSPSRSARRRHAPPCRPDPDPCYPVSRSHSPRTPSVAATVFVAALLFSAAEAAPTRDDATALARAVRSTPVSDVVPTPKPVSLAQRMAAAHRAGMLRSQARSSAQGGLHRRKADQHEPYSDWSSDIALMDTGKGYLTDIQIGTPPQTLKVLVDTGSSFLWVLDGCIDPTECGKSQTFNTKQSSTLKETSKPFTIPYMDGWTSGSFAYDTVTVAEQTAEHFAFGLSDNLTAWQIGAAGLLGMGPQRDAWWRQVSDSWAEPYFSLYLDPFSRNADSYTPEDGGARLVLGGTDESLYTGNVSWVPANTSMWWAIGINGASIQGHDVPMTVDPQMCVGDAPLAIVDSGSTVMEIPKDAAAVIYPALGVRSFHSVDLIPSETADGPDTTITYTLGEHGYPVDGVWGCDAASEIGATFGLSKSDLADAPYWCVPNMLVSDVQRWVLGAPFLQTVYSLYEDSGRQPRVGFAALSSSAASAAGAESSGTNGGGTRGEPASDSAALRAGLSWTAMAALGVAALAAI